MTTLEPILGRLQLRYDPETSILGKGHFGVVFEAWDPQLGGKLAVKQLPKVTFGPDHRAYFIEAARIYASRHPHVMQVMYACEDDDDVYIAMPLYSKGSVGASIEARIPTIREVVRTGLGLLAGLHHIHTIGLLHGDVKPSNILIADNGNAVVADFGLATKVSQASGTATMPVAYKAHWPPEYLISNEVTTRFDVYQAGLTLYRMIFGNQSVHTAWHRAGADAQERLKSGSLLDWPNLPHVTPTLRRALKAALHANPDERIATCYDFLNSLAMESKLLDWRLQRSDDQLLYRNERDDREGEVVVIAQADRTYSVESTKKRGKGRSKVTAHCTIGLTEARAVRFARSAMLALEE